MIGRPNNLGEADTRRGKTAPPRFLLAAALSLAVAGLLVAPTVRAAEEDHAHGSDAPGSAAGRVGLLLADHGEPPEYNEWTYESFREFFQHLIAMGLIPSWLSALETGTILYDADCPGCPERSDEPRLIDAWLRPHDGPAVFVPASDSLAAHYVLPGGPGFREPDIFEHVGLAAWHEWQRMGGRSPNYDEKLPRKQAVIRRLEETYGDGLAVRVGYMIDPRFGGRHHGVREALDALVNRDRIESLVVVYHGVGFSDIMQTHHLRHLVADHLEHLGVDIPVRFAEPAGTSAHYVRAAVAKVNAELAKVPANAPVAIHLSGHGLPTTMCGDYDCGADAYHRSSANLFARVKPAVMASLKRPGRTEVFHLYGDGAEGDSDPDDKVDSPIEALDKRAAAGFTHVIDVPYEFDANSRDTLIILRNGYRRTAPDWNRAWESAFTYKGMQITIANANGGDAHKIEALHDVTVAALGASLRPASADVPPPAATSDDHHHSAAAALAKTGSTRRPSQHGHDERTAVEKSEADHGHDAPSSTVGVAPRAEADQHHRAANMASGHAHTEKGGAGRGTGLALGAAGLAALVTAAVVRRRPLGGRLVAAGLGAQLIGLGWDVLSHAEDGAGVNLLENEGHWTAAIGLAISAVAAATLLSDRLPARLKRAVAS